MVSSHPLTKRRLGLRSSNARPTRISSSHLQATNWILSQNSLTSGQFPHQRLKRTLVRLVCCSSRRRPKPPRTLGNSSRLLLRSSRLTRLDHDTREQDSDLESVWELQKVRTPTAADLALARDVHDMGPQQAQGSIAGTGVHLSTAHGAILTHIGMACSLSTWRRHCVRLANRLLMKACGGDSASRQERRVQVYGRTFWGRDQSLFNTFFPLVTLGISDLTIFISIVGFVQGGGKGLLASRCG